MGCTYYLDELPFSNMLCSFLRVRMLFSDDRHVFLMGIMFHLKLNPKFLSQLVSPRKYMSRAHRKGRLNLAMIVKLFA